MTKTSSWKLIFKGVVQGVGFRPTVYRIAQHLGSHGYVINKGSAVEVVIDTNPDEFINELKQSLPTLAEITTIKTSRVDKTFQDFSIKQSTDGQRQSLIPVDTAICSDCLQELFDPTNRRYQFPFTNCTVCGARFSAITGVPYDREKTSMSSFPLCKSCEKEYRHPMNRRYHAQTISCPTCGPHYQLYDRNKKLIQTQKPIQQFAKHIDDGDIGVVKSWGGMHLCCTLDQIKRFRDWYHRPQKAFAIMVDSLETAETYALMTSAEKKLLVSNQRPIVLMKKKKGEAVSPGLDRIGLFLPYTGLHHLLFFNLEANALIMTSANIPGEPMIVDNNHAFSLHADCYLLHNRDIPNRVDDTVIKLYNNHRFFIRKARGFVPDPIPVSYTQKILSVGAGENVYGALSSDKKLFLTQYIGHSNHYQTLTFLEESLTHLIDLTMRQGSLDAVALDAHPGYETRSVAKSFADRFNAPLIEVQHHWAHAVSLLADNHADQAVVLSLDGLGYGDDNSFWGGEVIACDAKSYQRIGHLQPIPLIGGDKAAVYPKRVLFALFNMIGEERYFSGKKADIFRKLIAHSPKSSSLGRILDALSCYLGICCQRTYDGEPAMKLERYLAQGSNRYDFSVTLKNNVVQTASLFEQLDEQKPKHLSFQQKADLAYSFVFSIIHALTKMAIQHASTEDIGKIGITGGISYNIPIVKMVEDIVQYHDFDLLIHHRIPNGDGGIAIGQNIIAAHQLKHQ
ncbi:MAG: carbamoyltransferase HypF [Thermoplasmatota archaeon]